MINLVVGLLAAALGVVRLVESIYQLRQKPELNTMGKCWQVLVNFFKVEKYPKTTTIFEDNKNG